MQTQKPPTIPQFTRDDFHVRGDNGYHYPFASKDREIHPLSDEQIDIFTPHAGLLGDLRSADGEVYTAPGFDLQATVDSIGAPTVEVSGPTTTGFALANGVQFKDRPIITNVRGSFYERRGASSLSGLDRLVIDALADARGLPFADDSVGVLLASCVPKLVERPISRRRAEKEMTRSYEHALANADDPSSRKFIKASRSNPRIGLMQEASRILQPGGLFIVKGVVPDDVELAQHFGLTPVMCTPPQAGQSLRASRVVVEVFPREVVLQKQQVSE